MGLVTRVKNLLRGKPYDMEWKEVEPRVVVGIFYYKDGTIHKTPYFAVFDKRVVEALQETRERLYSY